MPKQSKWLIFCGIVAILFSAGGFSLGLNWGDKTPLILSDEIKRCEEANGEFRMWWNEYDKDYRVMCEVPQKSFFDYNAKSPSVQKRVNSRSLG